MIQTFPGKRDDENIIAVFRKHPIVYVRLIFIFLFTSALPVTVFLYFWSDSHSFSTTSIVGVSGYLGACFFILFSLAIFLVGWLNEEFDIFILTDQRLVDITQVNFFKRTVASTQLRNIEDTTSDVHGILPTLLNYGNLDVQTAAGDASDFYMDHVPDPAGAGRIILNAVYEGQKRHTQAVSQGLENPDKNVDKGKAT